MGIRFVGVKEAAQMLGVSEKTIRRFIKAGKLRAEYVPEWNGLGKWSVNYESLMEAMAEVVVPLSTSDIPQASTSAIVQVMQALQERDDRLLEKMSALGDIPRQQEAQGEDIAALRAAIEALAREVAASREELSRPWWRKLLGRP